MKDLVVFLLGVVIVNCFVVGMITGWFVPNAIGGTTRQLLRNVYRFIGIGLAILEVLAFVYLVFS